MSGAGEPPKPAEVPQALKAASPSKPRRSFENPALKAMGINRIRLPSRNWSIFWAVTSSITGLYFWDRYERKRIRQEWKDKVSFLAKQPMSPTDLPRKVTVYIAPPPGDYLDLGFSHFRQYIKPILTAAAIDFEVRSENKQGQIRNQVAEEIRNERRKVLGLPLSAAADNSSSDATDDQIQRLLTGQLHRDETGGVICVGRGAYKEYINGLHEGWLGPLEAPKDALDEINEAASENPEPLIQSAISKETVSNLNKPPLTLDEVNATKDTEQSQDESFTDAVANKEEMKEEAKEDNEESKKPKDIPVPKPYIKREEYGDAQLPYEFQSARIDTIAPIGFPHLIGFLTIPIRIYRFFNRRELADEMGRAVTAVVLSPGRPFDLNTDVDALKEEEKDWPSNWKKRGLENDSEWMQEFVVDPRVAERLTVYEEYKGKRVDN